MRIAHIESSMNWGGQELRIVEQTDWLNQHGHPTWIIARPDSAILREAQQRDLPVLALDIRGSANPRTYAELAQFVRTQRIDLLDCHGNRDSAYGAALKWLTGLPVVRSRHVTDPVRSSALRKLVWRTGNHGIVVTAERVAEILVEAGFAPRDRIYVAAAGVETDRFHPQRDGQALRAQLGIPAHHRVIANVGMIRPDKGQRFFVQACLAVLAQHDDLTCIHLGEATRQTEAYKQEVLALAGDAIAEGKIRFLGYQTDIENWLAVADMVVIASIATEAQTRLVAQAFLMQKNVVATTTGGLPEMITHRQTGLLCEPASASALTEAIDTLLTDPALAATLREQAYHHAQQHMTFDHMMTGMLATYQHALTRAGRKAG